MNDFTKEELQIISGSLYFTLLCRHSEATAEVRNKIQLLIKSYGEPEEQELATVLTWGNNR